MLIKDHLCIIMSRMLTVASFNLLVMSLDPHYSNKIFLGLEGKKESKMF